MRAMGWEPIPDKTPFVMRARFSRRALWRGDVDNLAKTVLDSAQGIVFRDDVYCVRIHAEKERGPDWSWIEFEETEVVDG
jgi:Holliday junction resolvase RusA-like endonuclease